ncbi:hypothetical protein EV356DRAFT_111079 [Viridothelium virens]|uniref:NB-ARC domain-containing protein n=1 Tax=Viridothelium virens TaxID=1048519 RepID=A0A6A6HNV2_VIRVR|nr:hypothetical protein EV356DRAFT_111079 [Viridothelium virens]
MRELQARGDVRLLVTSRPIPAATDYLQGDPQLEVRASEEDIKCFVAAQIPHLPRCIKLDETLKNAVQTKIVEVVDGMFLLARLHIDSLLDKRTKRKVESTLNKFSKGSAALEHAYGEAIRRIESQMEDDRLLARRVICLISLAKRLLKTEELC